MPHPHQASMDPLSHPNQHSPPSTLVNIDLPSSVVDFALTDPNSNYLQQHSSSSSTHISPYPHDGRYLPKFWIFFKKLSKEFFFSKFQEFTPEMERVYIEQAWRRNMYMSKVLCVLVVFHAFFAMTVR